MTRTHFTAVAVLATAVFASAQAQTPETPAGPRISITPAAGETHLTNIRQLTYGGENAEAYFSPDGQWLIFQSTRDGRSCDQEFIMRSADGSAVRRVSG